ncbi:17249_t:CDS:2, partial [Racocetra persica]
MKIKQTVLVCEPKVLCGNICDNGTDSTWDKDVCSGKGICSSKDACGSKDACSSK